MDLCYTRVFSPDLLPTLSNNFSISHFPSHPSFPQDDEIPQQVSVLSLGRDEHALTLFNITPPATREDDDALFAPLELSWVVGGVRVVWGDVGDLRCRLEMMTELHPPRASNAMKEGVAARLILAAPTVCCVFVVLSIVVLVMALCPRLLCHSTLCVPYLTRLEGVVSWATGLPGLNTSA